MQTEEKMYLKIESSWGLGASPGTSTYTLDGNVLTIEEKSFFSISGNTHRTIRLTEEELSRIKEKYNELKSYVEENQNKPEMMMLDASYSVEIGPEKSRINNDMNCYDQAKQLFDEIVMNHSIRNRIIIDDKLKEIIKTTVLNEETQEQNTAVEKQTTDQPNTELPTQSDPIMPKIISTPDNNEVPTIPTIEKPSNDQPNIELPITDNPTISPLKPDAEIEEKIYIRFSVFGGLSGITTTYEINGNILTYEVSSAIYPEKNSIRKKVLSNEEMMLVKENYKELKEYVTEHKNDETPMIFDAGWTIEVGTNGEKIKNDNTGYKMVRHLFVEVMDENKELEVQVQEPVQEPKALDYLKEKYPYLFDEDGNLKMDTERILGVLNDVYKNNTYQNNENKSISM